MKLNCIYPHMANKAVLVNGNRYSLDADCCVEIGKQEDCDKLLAGAGWREFKVNVHTAPRQVVLKATGKPVEKPAPVVVAPVVEEPVVVEDEPEAEITVKAVEEDSAGWEIPEEGEDWPDPTEDMPIEYLRDMAKAYQLKVHHATGKAKLVALLTEAMFDDEE